MLGSSPLEYAGARLRRIARLLAHRAGGSALVRRFYGIDATFRGWTLAATALGLLHCGASAFDGHVFRDGDVAFRLNEVPASWRRVEVDDAALAFRDDEQLSTILLHARCGKDAQDVPLTALRQHLFIHFTEREVEREERIALDAREALVTQMSAKLDGVRKHFDSVVFKKDGCVYDFIRVADQAGSSSEFVRFYRGFSTL